MNDDDQPLSVVPVAISASFYAGGPVDGSGFVIQVPVDTDLTGMHMSFTRPDGMRDLYTYEPPSDPESPEAGMRYLGIVASLT